MAQLSLSDQLLLAGTDALYSLEAESLRMDSYVGGNNPLHQPDVVSPVRFVDKAPVSPAHARALATEHDGGIELEVFETANAEQARVHLALQFATCIRAMQSPSGGVNPCMKEILLLMLILHKRKCRFGLDLV